MAERKLESILQINKLYNIVYHTLPSGFVFEGEQHDYWEMTYIDKGQLLITFGNEEILLSAGDFFLYPPNVFHTCRNVSSKSCNALDVAFDASHIEKLPFSCSKLRLGYDEMRCLHTIIREATHTYAQFKTAIVINMDYTDSPPIGSEHIIKNRLEELLVYLSRYTSAVHLNPEVSSTGKQKPSQNRELVRQIQSYIAVNYPQKLTLELIAKAHNISVTHLKRVFKEHTGVTIIGYLTDVRINEAMRMIREGKLNFSQIAQAVGYDGIFYFSDVFKKKVGMSPTEYANKEWDGHSLL